MMVYREKTTDIGRSHGKFAISIATVAAALLSGCSVGDEIARDKAKGVVTPIVQEQFPGIPAELVTNCVIDNSSAVEILTLAAAAGTGASGLAAETVVEIASRPETLSCIAKAGLPTLLRGLS